ncbi:MAG: glycerol-3-phosphate dehydrogenase [Micavibrio sp.]|nr:MAG: glycerol-3-phosphate dehydrogenase [Micavibrio sp.]
MVSNPDYDLCIIGGGINGAGIARDAAGRGLSVLLVEAGDLASATSSASTKLIHGGLRYLEYFEFGLVRESLCERKILLQAAPHMVRVMEFVLPHDEGQRPVWMIRLGLFLYDHLAGRKKLAGSKAIDLKAHEYGKVLDDKYAKGFVYSDCQTNDARLVVLNALDAQERGAEILTHTACTKLRCDGDHWNISLRDLAAGQEWDVRASMVINAAGPWVRGVLEASDLVHGDGLPNVRLVKGSHIVVPRRYDGAQAYIIQQKDKRIVFVIPYEDDFTLIGTTEEDFEGDPIGAQISQDEVEYLCAAYNDAFRGQVTPGDIVCSYSGVRPLFDDGKENATSSSRGYKLYRHKDMQAPMISVFGGKLTTYRHLAEEAVSKILKMAGKPGAAWSAPHSLPGGDIDDYAEFISEQKARYPWIPKELLRRYGRAYGTRMARFLDGANSLDDLGAHYGDGIYEAEVVYLVRYEWAREVEDILWRRSKLGLHVSPKTIKNLSQALATLTEEVKSDDAKLAGD